MNYKVGVSYKPETIDNQKKKWDCSIYSNLALK